MDTRSFRYKDELLNEALKEFADKGFDSASLNQIIKRSGISKGSFYYHFDNKEELFSSVMHRAAREKIEFISQWVSQQSLDPTPKGLFDILRLQMAGGIEFALQRPHLSSFLLSIMKNPELKAKALALSPPYYEEVFDALVQEAWQKGELRQDMDPGFIKKLLYYSLMNMGEMLLDETGQELERGKLVKQVECFMSFLQEGLGARSGNLKKRTRSGEMG